MSEVIVTILDNSTSNWCNKGNGEKQRKCFEGKVLHAGDLWLADFECGYLVINRIRVVRVGC